MPKLQEKLKELGPLHPMVLDEKLCDAADALLKKYFQYYEEQDDGLTREQYKKDESRRNTLEDHEIRST
mgnify:CR=1 FL=1